MFACTPSTITNKSIREDVIADDPNDPPGGTFPPSGHDPSDPNPWMDYTPPYIPPFLTGPPDRGNYYQGTVSLVSFSAVFDPSQLINPRDTAVRKAIQTYISTEDCTYGELFPRTFYPRYKQQDSSIVKYEKEVTPIDTNLYFYGKPYTVRALNQPISVELQGQGFVAMPLTLLIDLPSLPGDPIDPTQDFGDNGPFNPGITGVNDPPKVVPQWYLYDHLGNTRSMLSYDCSDDEFFVTFAADYYPYGKTLWEYHFTHLDGEPLEPGYEENARYMSTQHERDKQTNFDFRGARYYDSNIARFLSVDPLAADYTAWSPYNYVLGNPVRYVDPDDD